MKTGDEYVQRSVTTRPTNRLAKASRARINKRLLARYRLSKRDPKIYVEKSKYAISSFREKKGIPYKAQRLRRAGLLKTKKRKKKPIKFI